MANEERTGDGTPSLPKPIIKIDGFVRRQTSSVDVETLNQKGVTKINILTYSKINELISLAVLRAFQKYGRAYSAEGADAVRDEARAQVRDVLAGRPPPPAADSVDSGRKSLEREVETLRPMVESRIEEIRRGREVEETDPVLLAIRDQGLAELEGRVRSAVSRFLDEEKAAGSTVPLGRDGMDRFERDLHGVVSRMFAAEGERMLEMLERVAAEKTRILERRLEKLKGHLSEMEDSLKALAAEKGIDSGIPSVYKEIQGLSLDDGRYEAKKKMLAVLFEDNLKLQKVVP